jgi:tetratricopeptide (TPR) repeat protein
MGVAKNLKLLFTALSVLVISFLLPASPPHTCAAESIYTIQTGSYDSEAMAQKAFDALKGLLSEEQLDDLRIEKIGKYYSLRLGKFGRRDDAYAFYGTVQDLLEDSIVMNAYYKPERIRNLYVNPSSDSIGPSEPEVSLSPPVSARGENGDDAEAGDVVTEKTGVQPIEEVITGSLENRLKEISSLMRKEDYEAALKVIVGEIGKRPDSHELYAWYGAVLLKTDRPSQAVKYYKKAIELSPGVSDYHNGAGYSLLFLNRADNSIVYFRKALEIEPEHMDALFGLATAYARSGDREKAFEVYGRIMLLDREAARKVGEIIKSGS